MDYRHENQQQRQQLLTIVDRGTAEQLFTFLQRFHRRPFQNVADVMVYEGVIDDEINFIDCTGTRYSVTPLIIAAGKGSYEKAKILLVHGANPNKQCATGDTALNLAVHRQKYPVVDLLLQYHANPNVYNQAGKTALHRAVILHNDESINLIRKLLAAGADPTIEDRNQRIPLDEAVIANRPEIVDVLLSHDQTLTQRAYRAAIIASRLGHDKCLEILINYGMNPNITDRTNTTPLHVAVRSLQLSTARLLIAKGANQNIVNNRGETAMDIARLLQADQQQNFINVLLHSPKIAPSDSYSYRAENAILQIYPLLRNHSNWTLDSDEFRSRTAQNSSVQNLLDTSSRTYWCCPQTENAWVIFDLKHQYNINGVRIIGCENQSTPKNGHIDVSNALNGPWLKVKDFTCLLTQGNKNDFFFPSLKTRFIRVFILDNYGAGDIQIQGISFFGVDMRLVDLLKEYNLENSLSTLLANGINDQETLIENQDEILNSSDKYLHVNDHFRFVHLTESLKSPQLTFLEWFNPPQTTVIAGEKLRTFSVAGNEGVTNRIKLEEKLENNPEATTVLMRDLEPIQGRSLVDFPDYIIKNPGRYKIRVVSIESSDIHTPWQEIVVGPTLSYSSRLNTEADEQLYLLSTTHLLENTTSDKESTLRSQKKSTTPTTRDNRAFIVKVYESENEDTEDDTYLLSLKSIEDSPYYFPFKNMSHTTDSGFVNYQRRPYKPEHYTQTKMVDYYDHSTNTDDDYEDSSNPSRLNYNLRPGIHLTPTKYRSESRTPLSNIFPNTNIRNEKQSDDYETLDFGDKIIIPTKYRLQQERIKRLLNDENINRSLQQSPIQIEEQSQYQQRQSQNQNEFNQELPQRQRARKRSGSEEGPLQHKQQQSHYHPRQQSRHQDGLARESSPEQDSHYYELDQSQKQSEFVRESPPQQHRSRYQQQQQQQQFQRRTNSEESLPQQQQSNYHQREQLQNQNAQLQDSLSTPPKQQQSQYRQQEQPRQRSRSERESSPQQQQEADYYEIDQTQKPSDSVRGSPSQQQQSQYHQQEQLQNQNARVQDPLSTPPQQQQSQYHQREQLQNQNTRTQDSLSTPPQQQRLQYHQQEQLQNQNARVQDPLSTPPQQQQSQYHQREQLQNQNTRIQDSLSTPPQQQRLQYHQQEQSRQQTGSERESSAQQQQANYYEIDQSQKRSESTQESPPQQQQSQYHQQEQLQTHNARVQDSLPPQHQQQSHYQQREQSPQRSGSSRESSPERPQSGYYQPEQSQKRSESTRKSPPRQQQTQQRNDSRSETLPPQQKQQQSRKQNKSEQDSSHLPPYYAEVPQSGVESDEESKVTHQHQQQLSLEIINQDDLKPIYNRYQVISGDFELRESPSGDSSHTNGSKPAQMQLIFKATLQGPDVQKRAKDSIYELANNRSGTQSASNTNKQNNLNKTSYPTNLQSSINADRRNQITTNLVSSQENEYQTGSNYTARLNPVSHIAQSPTSRTKPDDDNLSTIVNYPSFEPSSPPNQSIKRSIFDDHTSNQLEPSNITIYSANDDDLDDIRERSHSPSQNYTSSKYDKNPLKQTNDSSSVPLLSSPKSMPKSFEHKSKYFFGENVPNQLSDDNEDDETECETFGHNSQARSLINTTIGRNLNYPYTTNPQFSINNNNYSENLQFAQHIDVGTATGNSLTQQERRSSSSNQSTVEKTPDSPHDSLTITSNKQIPPQGGYGALGIRVASPNYTFGNQNISTTASSRTGFQQQYPPDSDRYGPNSGSSIRQGQSKTRFDQDEDDDNQSHSEADDDDNNNIDNDQEDDNDIQDPSHDDHDDPKYMNDDEDDGSHHSTPRQSEVDESFKNNPVRDISNLPPMQYPPMNVIPLSQPDIYDTKKKNKKGGLFGLFGKDKTKDVDKINRKSSKQKSNKKKEKSSYKEKT